MSATSGALGSEGQRLATALLVVDVQCDFLPGGSLAVPDGDAVVEPLRQLAGAVDYVVLSRDLHPVDHCSFVAQGGRWPVHCVAGTSGAEFYPGIAGLRPDRVVDKAVRPDLDAYSAFDGTDLAAWLRAGMVRPLIVAGLATDYCVRASALDAIALGFDVTVVPEACRAVDVRPGDGERALAELRAAGVRVEPIEAVLRDG